MSSYTDSSSSDSCPSPSSEPSSLSTDFDDDSLDTTTSTTTTDKMIPAAAPALPLKSARRASRFLAPINTKAAVLEERPLSVTTPHEYYLSSEEDASSSADDFSEFEFDSEDEPVVEKARANPITARAVSVIYSGKPVVVDLRPRRSRSAGSSEAMGIRRAETEPSLMRPVSTISTTFTTSHTAGRLPLDMERNRPSFLNNDPFASSSKGGDDIERPKTPLTPTAMVKRGLSLMKKKSKPSLNSPGMYSRENFSVQTLPDNRSPEDSPTSGAHSPYYEDMMRTARARQRHEAKTSDASSVMTNPTQSSMSRLRAGFNLSSLRSVRT